MSPAPPPRFGEGVGGRGSSFFPFQCNAVAHQARFLAQYSAIADANPGPSAGLAAAIGNHPADRLLALLAPDQSFRLGLHLREQRLLRRLRRNDTLELLLEERRDCVADRIDLVHEPSPARANVDN